MFSPVETGRFEAAQSCVSCVGDSIGPPQSGGDLDYRNVHYQTQLRKTYAADSY